MVTDIKMNGLKAADTAQLRQQAVQLLERLVADREQSEKRFADSGKRDPMKFITGRTSLENAIASTREMIADMDVLLAKFEAELDEAGDFDHSATRIAGRASRKNGSKPVQAAALTGMR